MTSGPKRALTSLPHYFRTVCAPRERRRNLRRHSSLMHHHINNDEKGRWNVCRWERTIFVPLDTALWHLCRITSGPSVLTSKCCLGKKKKPSEAFITNAHHINIDEKGRWNAMRENDICAPRYHGGFSTEWRAKPSNCSGRGCANSRRLCTPSHDIFAHWIPLVPLASVCLHWASLCGFRSRLKTAFLWNRRGNPLLVIY